MEKTSHDKVTCSSQKFYETQNYNDYKPDEIDQFRQLFGITGNIGHQDQEHSISK